MPLDRVTLAECDVVAALHHARAAGLAEQPFRGNGDVEIGVGLMRMQCGKEAGAAGAEDQDVGAQFFQHDLVSPCVELS